MHAHVYYNIWLHVYDSMHVRINENYNNKNLLKMEAQDFIIIILLLLILLLCQLGATIKNCIHVVYIHCVSNRGYIQLSIGHFSRSEATSRTLE